MSQYVTDTHPVFWHISNDPRLSAAARAIFKNADVGVDQILIPSIVLVEGVYLVERNKVAAASLDRLFYLMDTIPDNYTIVPLDAGVARALRTVDPLKVPEMPDRIILATAKYFGMALVTRDKDITSANIVPVVW